MNQTKGAKFTGWVTVKEYGSQLLSITIAWETPYVILETEDGQKMMWHSDDVEHSGVFHYGARALVTGFAYPHRFGGYPRLKRVKVHAIGI